MKNDTPREGSITVAVIDDHGIVREGVRMILENDGGVDVVGEAEDLQQAIEMISRVTPDVILLDLTLGEDSCLDHIPTLMAASPASRILVLTGMTDADVAVRSATEGAHGIVLKSQAGEKLITAIKKVHAGEVWFDRSLTASIVREAGRRRDVSSDVERMISQLTAREREIVALVGEGLVNKDIAKRIGVTEKTVRNHLTTVYSKLHVTGRLPLALFAVQNNLL